MNKLHNTGIEPIVKDEAESARLAGFASSILGEFETYVNTLMKYKKKLQYASPKYMFTP